MVLQKFQVLKFLKDVGTKVIKLIKQWRKLGTVYTIVEQHVRTFCEHKKSDLD